MTRDRQRQGEAVAGDLFRVELYRRIVEALLARRGGGVAICALGDVFADVKETVCADLDCRLMAKRAVACAWNLKEKRGASR